MARQVLDNGIVLPSEYSDDWYDDMTSNLTKLDEVIGSDAEKLDESDVGAAAISNDYDDLDDKPAYNILRRASVTLTAGGTGNYTDLDSDSKIKAGDYVLDAANKLYSITAIDAANSTYTVSSAAIINITDKSELGAAALSNNYNDLDNLPTIPTVNDATLTIQKNGVDVQTFTANASSNVTCNITVPTKTSDLTNDSNFVDTSNSAVASGITSAKVTSYDSHIADTDIHVTTADKTKWNNNITQAYVFRYSSTALVASSTNSNTLLDNTDNLKVGDKVIDSSGVLFSITAIDTVNSTFTIGTALVDLAQDSDVVHKSGDETVGGKKELSEITTFAGSSLGNEGSNNARTCMYSYCNRDTKDYSGIYQRRVRQNRGQGQMSSSDISQYAFDILENQVRTNNVLYFVGRDFTNDIPKTMYIASQCDTRKLGSSLYPWSDTITNQINGLEPSALSLPDLANGIDISSYITIGDTDSNYTPSVNGWIWIRLIGNGASIIQGDFGINSSYVTNNLTNEKWVETNLFVTKDVQATIRCHGITGIVSAKFYPCLGNV